MNRQCFTISSAPPAVGPYSHAVAAGNMLFVSGQGPFTKDGGYVPASFEEEARTVLDNLREVLEGCGSSLDRVVKTTIFLADMEQFAAFNGIYSEYFGESKPARSCIEAARLPKGIQVEVEAVALIDAG